MRSDAVRAPEMVCPSAIGAPTVSATEVEKFCDPLVPATLMRYVPGWAAAPVVNVSVDVPNPPGIEEGLNDAVIPAGREDVASETLPANPNTGVTFTARLTAPPTSVVCVPGVTESLNAGDGVPAQA